MQHTPLRICIFSRGMRRHAAFAPSPLGTVGGVLAGLGHSVTVLTGALPDGSGARDTEAGCTVHYIAGVPGLELGETFWHRTAETFDRLHESEGPFDLVMGRGATVWGFLRHSRHAGSVPLVLHEGTYPRWLFQFQSRLGRIGDALARMLAPAYVLRDRALWACLHRADRVVCISPALAAGLRVACWWNPPRTACIGYGFDPSRFQPQPPTRPHRLVSVGRMALNKGILAMIDVLARLGNRTATLEAMGPASDQILAAVHGHARRLGVTDRYTATGPVPNEDLLARLSGAAVFLFPSTHAEGLGKVVLEAMASGLPVVAYRQPVLDGIVVEGETGFQVRSRSVRAMARRVDQLLADPALQARMAAAARRKIETDFAPAAINAQWQALLAEVVAEARARRGG